ncbi:MAG: ribonuclease J [Desulfobacteraceae bacterium]|nr:ribonuclease J [Desulfobacteraceae bacterium]MDH3722533.1 ribonuclease J [Desulfobacteraceae bacterium]MDH3875556.1 ribonuclease J [Desulfobacteraceae bacterium]MDH3882158.1 ribonuclease J [Desulfobacteraceae bacterium]PLX53591.1 MAG: ribonuclease J [Desulfobacteraceae bacterium]
MLKIIPLGGLGEIGLNMMVFEYGDSAFIVDVGLMFPEDYMLGIDYVIPDMNYIKQIKSNISGVVLTHAHEDHIGALPYLLKEMNLPIYGTPFTLGVVRKKLEEHGLFLPVSLHEISPRSKLELGVFELEFIRVCHSAVDGVGIAIKTPLGLVIHTGDFKISHTSAAGMITDVNKFAQYGEKGVLALLSDSTNVEREGYTISDQEVGDTLGRISTGRKGRIIIGLFASSITRIQQVIDIAKAINRKVIFNGRSIETSVNIAKNLGYINILEEMEIGLEQISEFPDEEIIIITTGSQGEPMAALARMAAGTHKQIKIKKEDTVILSSKFIPGNEKAITKIINDLYRRGADVIYEKISQIHVSGHAFQEELKLMINLTRPKYFIPIHGEYRHLVLHSRLAEQVGIVKENILLAENGQIIEFDQNGGKVQDSIVTGRVLIDGKGVGDVGRSVLKERRDLSEDGLVIVNMAFDEETGIVTFGPEIVSRGFVFETETGHLLEDAKCVILEIVEEIGPEVPDRARKIRSKISKALRKYFFFTIKRRPVILPFILEV